MTVFAIVPGWVSTAMTEYVTHSNQGKRWMPWTQSVIGTDAHVPSERAAQLVACWTQLVTSGSMAGRPTAQPRRAAIRDQLINIPARIATSTHRFTLRLPSGRRSGPPWRSMIAHPPDRSPPDRQQPWT